MVLLIQESVAMALSDVFDNKVLYITHLAYKCKNISKPASAIGKSSSDQQVTYQTIMNRDQK